MPKLIESNYRNGFNLKEMRFESVFILGISQLAYQCAKIIKSIGIPVTVFDTSPEKSVLLERRTLSENIRYFHIDRKQIFEILVNVNKKTLLLSVVNPYLIPAMVLENRNIKAINCHHSILPKHPGRNAEAWSIFEQDSESGITWHIITPNVDAGQIIVQKNKILDETITSFQLLKFQHDLAYQSFLEIVTSLVDDNIISYPQNMDLRGKLHYSWQVPNDGYINLDWNGDKISAFLRSMDYGILETLGKPYLLYKGECFHWEKYNIKKTSGSTNERTVSFIGTSIIINRGNYQIILADCSKIIHK
jgi:methionyl-tRNA formyltransferase